MKIVICRACRAPLAEVGERERRQREVATHRASKKLALAARRAMKCAEAREESGSDAADRAPARAHPMRIAEILRPWRREYDALPEEAQEQFLEVLRLFTAGRVTNSEWRATVRATRARYEATLPAPVSLSARVKVKDRVQTHPQGW
jgi:hypothetical protein